MISSLYRQGLLELLMQARLDGARWACACAQIGLSVRTVQRWRRDEAKNGDGRASDKRQARTPPNKLSEAERVAALKMLNSEEFKDLPPSQIVPRLADQGQYVASESTLYRLLREAGQLTHRRMKRISKKRAKPRALVATGPDQVYCWEAFLHKSKWGQSDPTSASI